jgi:hypothetical protein
MLDNPSGGLYPFGDEAPPVNTNKSKTKMQNKEKFQVAETRA